MRAWHQSSVSPAPNIVSQCRRWKPGAAISAGMSRGCMTLAMAQCRTLPTTSYLGHSSITMASRATAEALLLIRFLESAFSTSIQRRHPRFPMPDVSQTWKPQRLRSYPSSARTTPPLSNKDLVYPGSARLSRLVLALVTHVTRVFDMKNSTSSFAHDGWGITSSPLSCTCFGDCAGQDQSHTGYKLCRAPDIYCPPESVSFCPTLNFTLIPFHMRESWQEQDHDSQRGKRLASRAAVSSRRLVDGSCPYPSLFTHSCVATALEMGLLTPGVQR